MTEVPLEEGQLSLSQTHVDSTYGRFLRQPMTEFKAKLRTAFPNPDSRHSHHITAFCFTNTNPNHICWPYTDKGCIGVCAVSCWNLTCLTIYGLTKAWLTLWPIQTNYKP